MGLANAMAYVSILLSILFTVYFYRKLAAARAQIGSGVVSMDAQLDTHRLQPPRCWPSPCHRPVPGDADHLPARPLDRAVARFRPTVEIMAKPPVWIPQDLTLDDYRRDVRLASGRAAFRSGTISAIR